MTTRITAAYRWSDEVKARIQARAKAAGLSETEFVKRAALGELDVDPAEIVRALNEVRGRISRLEEFAFGAD